MSDDHWDKLLRGDFEMGQGEGIDALLGESGAYKRFASSLSPVSTEVLPKDWLDDPKPGTRVAFEDTLEAILMYKDFPQSPSDHALAEGTVVRVRTSSGDVVAREGRIFVQWDDGKLRAIERRHLTRASSQRRTASSFRKVYSNLGDITDFLQGRKGELVHKSTQDLWVLRKDGDQYAIERLFDDTGEPLKGV